MNKLGKRTTLPEAEQYYPVTILEPLRPENARLLGADLASLDGLGESLDTIARNNQSLLTTFAKSWSYGGQVVIFRPVYLGHQVPKSIEDTQRQAAGGFWIAVDVERFLGEIADRLKDFDINVEIVHGVSSRSLYSQSAQYDSKLFLRALYPRQQLVEQWVTDNSTLIMRFETESSYSAVVLLSSLLFMVALVLVVAQITSQRVQRLQRERQAEK